MPTPNRPVRRATSVVAGVRPASGARPAAAARPVSPQSRRAQLARRPAESGSKFLMISGIFIVLAMAGIFALYCAGGAEKGAAFLATLVMGFFMCIPFFFAHISIQAGKSKGLSPVLCGLVGFFGGMIGYLILTMLPNNKPALRRAVAGAPRRGVAVRRPVPQQQVEYVEEQVEDDGAQQTEEYDAEAPQEEEPEYVEEPPVVRRPVQPRRPLRAR